MKALIISDDQTVISKLDSFLQSKSVDTIIYRWLLKALDNIEEIRPNLIIVSSSEYPRHWKTLVQFVKSGIGGNDINIYLYQPSSLSSEDEEKAKHLGITGLFTDLSDETLTSALCESINEEIFSSEIEEKAVPINEKIAAFNEENIALVEDEFISVGSLTASLSSEQTLSENSVRGTGEYIFTNPVTNALICGNFFDYNGSSITLNIPETEDISAYTSGYKIQFLTFCEKNIIKSCTSTVTETLKLNANNLLVLKIGQFYEEI